MVKSTKNFLLYRRPCLLKTGPWDRNALTDYMVSNLQDIVSRV